eukprot:Pgem_evm2s13268
MQEDRLETFRVLPIRGSRYVHMIILIVVDSLQCLCANNNGRRAAENGEEGRNKSQKTQDESKKRMTPIIYIKERRGDKISFSVPRFIPINHDLLPEDVVSMDTGVRTFMTT